MSKNQKTYTQEFRQEAVRLLESSDKSVSELARELGINEKALYRWRAKYGTRKPAPRSSAKADDDRDAELARLRRENEILRQERDILKKAISIVSQNQP